jgi:hypothetical protein
VTSAIEDSVAALDNVPDGGVFMWSTDIIMANWYEMAPPEIAVFKHMMERARDDGCKIMLVTTYVVAGHYAKMKILAEEAKPADYGLTYGEDYAITGWIPGYETTMAGMLQDFWGITGGKDYQGTPYTQLPMMDSIRKAGDFHLLGYSTSTSPDTYARQWGVGVGVNNVPVTLKDGTENPGAMLIGSMLTGSVPIIMPFIDKGLQTSYISGQRGGAEYEVYRNTPGAGLASMAGQSMGHFYAIALVIVTNILFNLERRK